MFHAIALLEPSSDFLFPPINCFERTEMVVSTAIPRERGEGQFLPVVFQPAESGCLSLRISAFLIGFPARLFAPRAEHRSDPEHACHRPCERGSVRWFARPRPAPVRSARSGRVRPALQFVSALRHPSHPQPPPPLCWPCWPCWPSHPARTRPPILDVK